MLMTALGRIHRFRSRMILVAILLSASCASTPDKFHDQTMDFAAVRSVAVMPFTNLTSDKLAGERVRDVFITALLSTESMYVLPTGEVARGASRAGIADPTSPTPEEAKKMGDLLKVNAVITGVVREYGEARSGTASSNIVSLSMAMMEVDTGKVVWTASSTKGGISVWDRLFGGGGEPMNIVTKRAVDEILDKLFQ
jgi:hypothetical protein